jgi:hypothetical protein
MAALRWDMTSCSNVEERTDVSDKVALSAIIYGDGGGNEIILNVREVLLILKGVTL